MCSGLPSRGEAVDGILACMDGGHGADPIHYAVPGAGQGRSICEAFRPEWRGNARKRGSLAGAALAACECHRAADRPGHSSRFDDRDDTSFLCRNEVREADRAAGVASRGRRWCCSRCGRGQHSAAGDPGSHACQAESCPRSGRIQCLRSVPRRRRRRINGWLDAPDRGSALLGSGEAAGRLPPRPAPGHAHGALHGPSPPRHRAGDRRCRRLREPSGSPERTRCRRRVATCARRRSLRAVVRVVSWALRPGRRQAGRAEDSGPAVRISPAAARGSRGGGAGGFLGSPCEAAGAART